MENFILYGIIAAMAIGGIYLKGYDAEKAKFAQQTIQVQQKAIAAAAADQKQLDAHYKELDQEDDNDIAYSADLEKKLAAIENATKLPDGCSASAAVVQLLNAARTADKNAGGTGTAR